MLGAACEPVALEVAHRDSLEPEDKMNKAANQKRCPEAGEAPRTRRSGALMIRLCLVVSWAFLFCACGDAADTLRGDPWTIDEWTYSIDDVFDGNATAPPRTNTTTATVHNAGTLTFTGGEAVTAGGGVLRRALTKYPRRGTTEAAFMDANRSDTLTWDPGGSRSESDQITIYSGSDEVWNAAWQVEGGGSDVTIQTGFLTEFSPTQRMVQHETLHLVR